MTYNKREWGEERIPTSWKKEEQQRRMKS